MAAGRITRRIDAGLLRAVLEPVRDWLEGDGDSADPVAPEPPRAVLAAAVRGTLRALAQDAPGKAVEVRVPPFGAVQCLPGGTHTRGTPPHVVETNARHWLQLVTGRLSWSAAVRDALVHASGHRAAEVGALLPLPMVRPDSTDSDQSVPRFE